MQYGSVFWCKTLVKSDTVRLPVSDCQSRRLSTRSKVGTEIKEFSVRFQRVKIVVGYRVSSKNHV